MEVVRIFHSPPEALQHLVAGHEAVPFPVLADPEKRVYRLYGVSSSILGLLDPRGWGRAVAAARAGHKPDWRDTLRDGIGGLPADFQVGPDGRLERVHYGRTFTDSMQPGEVLAHL